MSSIQHFMYVCLNGAVFMGAVIAIVVMLTLTQDREDTMINDMSNKSSISMQVQEKETKEYVSVSGTSIYSDILSVADDDLNIDIYLGNTKISFEDREKIKNRKADVLRNLKSHISTRSDYRRYYEYDENLNITTVRYVTA